LNVENGGRERFYERSAVCGQLIIFFTVEFKIEPQGSGTCFKEKIFNDGKIEELHDASTYCSTEPIKLFMVEVEF
jgi:hypothetical protein